MFALKPTIPIWVEIIVYAVILAVTAISVIQAKAAAEIVSSVDKKVKGQTLFIPKYRKKSLYGQVRADVREIIQTLCKYKGVEIIEGAVCIDHITFV